MRVADEEQLDLRARLVEPAELGQACRQEAARACPIGLVPAQRLDGGFVVAGRILRLAERQISTSLPETGSAGTPCGCARGPPRPARPGPRCRTMPPRYRPRSGRARSLWRIPHPPRRSCAHRRAGRPGPSGSRHRWDRSPRPCAPGPRQCCGSARSVRRNAPIPSSGSWRASDRPRRIPDRARPRASASDALPAPPAASHPSACAPARRDRRPRDSWAGCAAAARRSRPSSASTILAGHLVLNGKDVLQAAVEAFRPQMIAAHRVDQLGVDAHAPRGAPRAALQQIAHAEILRRSRARPSPFPCRQRPSCGR